MQSVHSPNGLLVVGRRSALATGRIRSGDISAALEHLLYLAAHCSQDHLLARPNVRRLFNQAFFSRALIDAENDTQPSSNESSVRPRDRGHHLDPRPTEPRTA